MIHVPKEHKKSYFETVRSKSSSEIVKQKKNCNTQKENTLIVQAL